MNTFAVGIAMVVGIPIGWLAATWTMRRKKSALQRMLNELGHDHFDEIVALTAALEGEEILRLFHRFGRRWRTFRVGMKRLDNELCEMSDSFHALKSAWLGELEKVLVKIKEVGSHRTDHG